MVRSGLLGEKLAHSYSPEIHAELGAYEYKLLERSPEEVPRELKEGDWTGINVTIPYKKTVIPYLSELSSTAREMGSVNTLLRKTDGSLFGDNTDVYGFEYLVRSSGIDVRDKKALVLGNGGSAQSVICALRKLGASVTVISRSGEDNYTNLERHADARLIVNTTPLGMYPDNGAQALSVKRFPALEAVFDLIYNPARTALMLEAEALGIPAYNGLKMLVAQARRSSELFTGKKLPDGIIAEISEKLRRKMLNIALIGMPGAGKSSVARELGRLTGRRVLDCDAEVLARTGKTPAEMIRQEGEGAFRRAESQILAELSKQSACVIATGGGCVTVEGNYPLLRQNSIVVWLRRDIDRLPTDDRPLSQALGPAALYERRKGQYARFSDIAVDALDTPARTAECILEKIRSF